MEEKLLKVLETCNNFATIANKLKISKDELRKLIKKLVKEDKVFENTENNKVFLLKKGTIDIKKRGFGFIKVEEETEEYYVSEEFTLNSFDGDTVLFYPYSSRGKLVNAEVVKVVDRAKKFIIGKITAKKFYERYKYYVTSTDQIMTARIKEGKLMGALEGNVVKATLIYRASELEAEVESIIGHIDDPGIEITEIASNYGFEKDFDEDVMAEANKTLDYVTDSEMKNRVSYVDELTITIDGDDSKDFDDAVSLKELPNGNYSLGVYIADVANYVKKGNALNKEAFKRGTSVYLADRVIPMLPHRLSNGICSLNEGVNRLVMACIMEYTPSGELVKYDINEGVIKSAHRMTYSKVNKMLQNDQDTINAYQDIYPMITLMAKLSSTLRQIRYDKGGLEFEVDEYKITLNDIGKPINIKIRTRDKAEMLIEDFMLAANQTVAYHMNTLQIPCVYRVHEKPDQERLRSVFTLMNNLGYSFKTGKNDIHPKMIQQILEKTSDDQSRAIINQMFLRSMMKAKYTTSNLGHYGLAMQYYCHFTSPIRRYPDLLVHRLLKDLIIHPKNYENDLSFYHNNLEELAIHSSKMERNSIECEREVDDMLMAWYMEDYVKVEFVGIVTSIVPFGMFVTLPNGCEGLVALDNMDGYYTYDETKMALTSGIKKFSIGDSVTIVVIGASKATHKIDFQLKEDYLKRKE